MANLSAAPFPGTDGASSPESAIQSETVAGSSAPAGNGSAQKDGSELLERVVQGAHQTIDRLAEGVAPHVQSLQQGVTSASDALRERAGQAREMSDEWVNSLRGTVRENPLAALATALVAGVLIARLTQR